MVKLASAREIRMYGSRLFRNRLEYINAGLYVFASVVLICGFSAQFSSEPKSGLVLILIALVTITVVNVHDLVAHLAGFDYRFRLMEYDAQLAVVEFTAPLVIALGTVLFFLGIFFILYQSERGGTHRMEQHALNMLIAGSALWLLGSILNSCQIYERADGHVQILQDSVCIPFLMGSLLFIVGAVLNSRQHPAAYSHLGIAPLGEEWIWIGLAGSLLFFIGGLTNVVKVFKMQQGSGLRLEKLRGGAQERLLHLREDQVPFMPQDASWRMERAVEERKVKIAPPTPYKDVLVGGQT